MLVYIHPRSSFPVLPSDTIFGSICFALAVIDGESAVIEMLNCFEVTPPFLVSSAFPVVYTNGIPHHFFPKPIGALEPLEDFEIHLDAVKALKNVRFIHESLFHEYLTGAITGSSLVQNFAQYTEKSSLLFPKELELDFAIRSITLPRNVINRVQWRSEGIFYSSGMRYRNAGVFCILRFFDDTYQNIIASALRFISDRGFGRDVSVGKGHFDLTMDFEKEILPPPVKGSRFISLSRYHPTSTELAYFKVQRNLWYELVTKRGKTSGGSMKKRIRYFAEGSTFPHMDKKPYGKIVRVAPKAVEFGFAFDVGIEN